MLPARYVLVYWDGTTPLVVGCPLRSTESALAYRALPPQLVITLVARMRIDRRLGQLRPQTGRPASGHLRLQREGTLHDTPEP
jgi:hypothetical protein